MNWYKHMTETASTQIPPFGALLGDNLAKFERELFAILSLMPAEVGDLNAPFLRSGGKRLRPTLVFLSGSFGKPMADNLVRVAATMELVHTASLYHDDIVDKAAYRRGIPTLHRIRSPKIALFAGAHLLHLAYNIIAHLRLPSERALRRVKKAVVHAAIDICVGQLREVSNIGNLALKEKEYLDIVERKTGRLFELSCQLGALVADGPIEALSTYGRNFGILYQIADDLRDILCRSEELGKPTGSDLRQGIYTLPVIYSLERGDFCGRTLLAILRNRRGDLSPREISRLLIILRRSHAIELALEKAFAFGRIASDAIASLPSISEREALAAMVNHILFDLTSLMERRH